MCGFTGIYAFNEIGRFFSINLARANEALAHRGPDDAYLFTEQMAGLGHRRLAIIDLSSDARQPMSDVSERYTLAYNGEIYNFKELRNRLQSSGISFKSASDTEVLLYLFIEYGEKCLEMLNGFFAFAIYDKEENSMFIARDRYGIKPLWYYHDEDKFLFASELKALLQFNIEKEVNYNAVYQFFQLNYIPAPHTIFKNTFKLLPGHFIKIKGREVTIQQYYQLPKQEFQPMPSYQAAGKQFMELLEQSVQKRLVSDVPLGAFLSGGIDSSTIVALACKHVDKLHTFSIGYKDEPFFDETKYAQLVAKKYKTEHTVFQLSNNDLFEHITDILGSYAEPFADASAIPTYILSKKTRDKVTVALSGDAGDELLAGYQKYTGEWMARHPSFTTSLVQAAMPILSSLPKNRNSFFGNKARQLHRLGEIVRLSPQERYWHLCTWRSEKETVALLSEEALSKIDFEGVNAWKSSILKDIQGKNFNEILAADFHLLLPNDMLHKVDSMSMANGLEVRVPFLDHELVNYAFQLSEKYKIEGNFKKKILQDFAKPLLPKELYKRPKKGFDVPLAKAYKTTLKSWIEKDLLADDFIEEQNIFNLNEIKNLKQAIFSHSNFDQNQVWGILCFQKWWKNYIS